MDYNYSIETDAVKKTTTLTMDMHTVGMLSAALTALDLTLVPAEVSNECLEMDKLLTKKYLDMHKQIISNNKGNHG